MSSVSYSRGANAMVNSAIAGVATYGAAFAITVLSKGQAKLSPAVLENATQYVVSRTVTKVSRDGSDAIAGKGAFEEKPPENNEGAKAKLAKEAMKHIGVGEEVNLAA